MLFGSSALEVLIGVVLLFLVLAVIASSVAEIVSQVLALRSGTLRDAIETMLFDRKTRDAVFAHPLIKSLSRKGFWDRICRRPVGPSYIPPDVFAKALLDTVGVARDAAGALAVTLNDKPVDENLRRILEKLGEPLGEAITDVDQLATQVEKWFDDVMDRVTGWYKRKTQIVLILIGAIVVVWANANVLRYASALTVNPDARAAVVAMAEAATASPPPGPTAGQSLTQEQALDDLKQLDFALGWDSAAKDSRHLPASPAEVLPAVGANLLGWLFAIAAVSMGAPFWFDLLKNIVNLRGAGTSPDKREQVEAKKEAMVAGAK
jgi:hypothetical protein